MAEFSPFLASRQLQPCPRDATAAERIAARPAKAKYAGVKCQFLFIQTWKGIECIPCQPDAEERDCAMSNSRFLDVAEETMLPMAAKVGAKWMFTDGARCHCRPPLSSAENCEFLRDLLEPAGITTIEWPARAPDISWWENNIFAVKCHTKKLIVHWLATRANFTVTRANIMLATQCVVYGINKSAERLQKFRNAIVDHFQRLRVCHETGGAAVK